jgi:hypothetical protein
MLNFGGGLNILERSGQRVHPIRWRFLAFLSCVAASIVWLTTPRCAFACSCVPPEPPVSALAAADSVFAGRVTTIENRGDSVAVTFDVSTVWKGSTSTTIAVRTALDDAVCGVEFQANQDYIVYATGSGADLAASLCSRTQPLANASVDLAELGPGQSPQVSAVVPSATATPAESASHSEADAVFNRLTLLLAPFIAAVLVAVIVLHRRSHQRSEARRDKPPL